MQREHPLATQFFEGTVERQIVEQHHGDIRMVQGIRNHGAFAFAEIQGIELRESKRLWRLWLKLGGFTCNHVEHLSKLRVLALTTFRLSNDLIPDDIRDHDRQPPDGL